MQTFLVCFAGSEKSLEAEVDPGFLIAEEAGLALCGSPQRLGIGSRKKRLQTGVWVYAGWRRGRQNGNPGVNDGPTNTEQKFNELRKFPKDATIDASETAQIWNLFKGSPQPGRLERFEYCALLQAALMAAIDGSAAMSWTTSLFKSALQPRATIKSIIKKVVKDALNRY